MEKADLNFSVWGPIGKRMWKGAGIGLLYSAIAPLVFEFPLVRESGPSLLGLTPCGWVGHVVVWVGNPLQFGFWSMYFISLVVGAALGAGVARLTYGKASEQ